jgi:Protein of unknown function (DUF1203)
VGEPVTPAGPISASQEEILRLSPSAKEIAMSFRVEGVAPQLFQHLFGATDEDLAGCGAVRSKVETKPGAPCRITLDDAEPGEAVLLLSFHHQPAATPYGQAGPIFVRENAIAAAVFENTVPPALARRMLSVRAFDEGGMMLDADLVEGADLPTLIARFWQNPAIAYLQAHNARRGCFAATITRL